MASPPTSTPPLGLSKAFPIHRPGIRYGDPSSKLQTLDIWLPRPIADSDPETTVWIVYIHGGAWRDPLQTSSCILPTLTRLAEPTKTNSATLSRIGGIASLNYRLSPYPSHPTHPSDPADADRNVQHPTHIQDVALAIEWLRTHYSVGTSNLSSGYKWVGVGHSCGATLLSQYVSGIGLSLSTKPPESEGNREHRSMPTALVLLEGIYDLPLLMKNHTAPKCTPEYEGVYRDILEGAFGPESVESTDMWAAASPTHGVYTASTWPHGYLVFLCHSEDDELVETEQATVMLEALERSGWVLVPHKSGGGLSPSGGVDVIPGSRVVETRWLTGGHDEIWEDGGQIAGVIGYVLGRWDRIR